MPQDQAAPAEPALYAMFVGPIDPAGAARLIGGLAMATKPENPKIVHLAIHSLGGGASDGVMLYNAFRCMPLNLTVYNIGTAASAAAIAFLGAHKRKAAANTTFMLHRCTNMPGQPTTASRLELLAQSLTLDDQRTEAILRERLKLTSAQMDIHRTADLWFSAQDALAAGIIDEIADFAPPMGEQVFTI